jgi:hypothetical protein
LLFIQTTAVLGIDDRINKTLVINRSTGNIPQAVDFFNQILSSLAYGGNSIVKTPDETTFHMRRIDRVESEISASVCGFPADFGG